MDRATICHCQSLTVCRRLSTRHAHLIGARDNLGEFAHFLILALDNGLDDGGMVGPEVDKDMAYAILPERLEKGKGCRVPGHGQRSMSGVMHATHMMIAAVRPGRSCEETL